jgi:hypothetical protein
VDDGAVCLRYVKAKLMERATEAIEESSSKRGKGTQETNGVVERSRSLELFKPHAHVMGR